MNKFPRGQVLDLLTYDFDGKSFEVTKYHPWYKNIKGNPSNKVEYHCEEMHQSAGSLMALLIHWIAFKRVGINNSSLAEGVCRALCVDLENKQ